MGLPRRLIVVFAIACGLVAANSYDAQPMLETIARQFHATSAAVGQIVTLSQLGFAVGLLLLVPLGYLLDRRRLIAVTPLVATMTLVGMTLAPSLAVLLVAGLLARPPDNHSQAVIGLLGLVGVAALGAGFVALALLLWLTELGRKRQQPAAIR